MPGKPRSIPWSRLGPDPSQQNAGNTVLLGKPFDFILQFYREYLVLQVTTFVIV